MLASMLKHIKKQNFIQNSPHKSLEKFPFSFIAIMVADEIASEPGPPAPRTDCFTCTSPPKNEAKKKKKNDFLSEESALVLVVRSWP